jgi:F-box domain
MEKRKRGSLHDATINSTYLPSPKRLRFSRPDRLSRLSDELILRILSFVDVSDLTSCQR